MKHICLKLTEESRAALLKVVPPLFKEEDGDNVFASHVTLAYCPDEATIDKCCWLLYEGQRVLVHTLSTYSDQCAQAVLVYWDCRKIICTNVNPHITISTKRDIPPVYSNKMMIVPDKKVPVKLLLETVVTVKDVIPD